MMAITGLISEVTLIDLSMIENLWRLGLWQRGLSTTTIKKLERIATNYYCKYQQIRDYQKDCPDYRQDFS